MATTVSLTALGNKTNSDFEVMNDGIDTEAAEEIYEYEETIAPVGYYVSAWNTEPDGSGTSYTIRGTVKRLLASGKTLYPILSPNTYTVRFVSNGGTGAMQDQVFTYDQEQALTGNAFANEDYWFYGWNTLQAPSESSVGTFYRDGQSVKNLTTANNGVVYLFAQWKTYELVDDVINPAAQYDVVSMNMALEESIVLQLKLNNLSDPEHLERYHITASFDGEATVNGTLSELLASGVTTIRDGKYMVPVAYPMAEKMVDTVHVCMRLDDGEGNSEVIEEFDYSVQRYCQTTIEEYSENVALTNLCKAVLDYGAHAQIYFNSNTNNLANGGTDYNDVANVVIPKTDSVKVGTCTGITGRTFSLVTVAQTEFVIYFKHATNASLSDYTFTVDGTPVTATETNSKYKIKITGIPAKDFHVSYTIVVTNTNDNTQHIYITSPIAYLYAARSDDFCKAIYNYHLAAKAYFS